eukprot:5129292-Prymnesium_polylepis.1
MLLVLPVRLPSPHPLKTWEGAFWGHNPERVDFGRIILRGCIWTHNPGRVHFGCIILGGRISISGDVFLDVPIRRHHNPSPCPVAEVGAITELGGPE